MDYKTNWLSYNAKIFPERTAIILHSSYLKDEKIFSSKISELNCFDHFITLSYSKLNEIVTEHAIQLSKNKINDKTTAIFTSNIFELLVNILSCWKLNSIPIPINSKLTSEELKSFFDENKIDAAIDIPDFPSVNNFTNINQTSSSILNFRKSLFDNNLDLEKTSVIIFTSGTINKPKGAELSFNNLLQSYQAGKTKLNYNSNDKFLISLPLFHIGGFSILTRTLLSNAALIIPKSLNIDDIIFAVEKTNPSIISLVSYQLKKIIEKEINPPKNLKSTLLGGGILDSELIYIANQRGWKIFKVYGSTETSAFITVLNSVKDKTKIYSVGKPLSPIKLKILDENKNELPPKSIGEIAVSSPTIFKKYFNNESETRNKFSNGLYLTGDIGYLDEDNYLYIENRKDNIIISGGEKINPLEVENVINTFPFVKDCKIFGMKDDYWGQIVAAAIVPLKFEQNFIEKLKLFTNEKLAHYKFPKKIFFVNEIPTTELGKVNSVILKNIISNFKEV